MPSKTFVIKRILYLVKKWQRALIPVPLLCKLNYIIAQLGPDFQFNVQFKLAQVGIIFLVKKEKEKIQLLEVEITHT